MSLPLKGIRILDMTVVWAGPYSTMFLADMGAEVIRVESINVFPSSTRGQQARPNKEAEAQRLTSMYPDRDPGERAWNRSAMFNAHSRNKHSITINLASSEGQDIFKRLVESSDIFIENNALGSMERLGFTYPTLSQWNPQLIMLSSTGMGQTGPWAHFRGFGLHFEALYGHASVTGYPDMDVEGVPSSVAADAAAGAAIAFNVVMGLHNRTKTGKGTFIDLSQGENFVPHLGELFMDYSMNKNAAKSLGNRDPYIVQGCYQCRGNDEWIAISLHSPEEWKLLTKVTGSTELGNDPRFSNLQLMYEHHDDIDEIISEWTLTQDNIEVFHKLQKVGIAAGPVLNEPLAYNDPHLLERNFFTEITHAEAGTHKYPTTAFRMSDTPFEVRKPPVRLGEDNDYIYRQVLKLTEEEYNHLKDIGQIGMDYQEDIP